MAMAAIGLRTNLVALFANGYKPILLGLCCWIAVSVAALVAHPIVGRHTANIGDEPVAAQEVVVGGDEEVEESGER